MRVPGVRRNHHSRHLRQHNPYRSNQRIRPGRRRNRWYNPQQRRYYVLIIVQILLGKLNCLFEYSMIVGITHSHRFPNRFKRNFQLALCYYRSSGMTRMPGNNSLYPSDSCTLLLIEANFWFFSLKPNIWNSISFNACL